MKKLFKNSILALLLISIASCSPNSGLPVTGTPSSSISGGMHKNTKGVFHIINTNIDLVPKYYYEYSKEFGCILYMEDNYETGIELSPGTYILFTDGNCLICNHK